MFKKKKEEFNPVQTRMKFNMAINKLQAGVEKYDSLIEEELAEAIAHRKNGDIEEEQRCMRNIANYVACKVQNERFRDNLKLVANRIEDMYNRVNASKLMSEAFGSIGTIVDSKELKGIMSDLSAFDKSFSKANSLIDAFSGSMEDTIGSLDVDTKTTTAVQTMVDRRMKGYEERIEQEVAADALSLKMK